MLAFRPAIGAALLVIRSNIIAFGALIVVVVDLFVRCQMWIRRIKWVDFRHDKVSRVTSARD